MTLEIDWTSHDKHPEMTCTCRCGARFRSHSKFVTGPKPALISRRCCPKCGSIHLQGASSDPEVMTISKAEVDTGLAGTEVSK